MLERTVVAFAVMALLAAACAAPGREPASPPEAANRSSGSSVSPQDSAGAPRSAENDVPGFGMRGWKTDFSKHRVPLSEIMSGGPPRDGIPPIDRPKFETVGQADQWLKPPEPIIHFAVGTDVRAYPIQILIWHEIVNDEVGGAPVTITFCPLCNTAIAFDRHVDGVVLDFGTTGNLRNSDLVMWDRQTESWWQQITGEAIVGELTGKRLELLPATMVSWEEFRTQFPEGKVLSRDTGFSRDYGRNPYVGYDRIDQAPFLFRGPIDRRLPPMERVVVIENGGETSIYPFSVLRERRVIADRVAGMSVVIFYQPGTASALDASSIASSRSIGATGVYRPEAGGRSLTFRWRQDAFVDTETGSRWTLLGQAISGPLVGVQLEPVVHGNHFWFATAAFFPKGRVFSP